MYADNKERVKTRYIFGSVVSLFVAAQSAIGFSAQKHSREPFTKYDTATLSRVKSHLVRVQLNHRLFVQVELILVQH